MCLRVCYKNIFFASWSHWRKEQDPIVRGTVPRIWIRTKMSRIPNTACSKRGFSWFHFICYWLSLTRRKGTSRAVQWGFVLYDMVPYPFTKNRGSWSGSLKIQLKTDNRQVLLSVHFRLYTSLLCWNSPSSKYPLTFPRYALLKQS